MKTQYERIDALKRAIVHYKLRAEAAEAQLVDVKRWMLKIEAPIDALIEILEQEPAASLTTDEGTE